MFVLYDFVFFDDNLDPLQPRRRKKLKIGFWGTFFLLRMSYDTQRDSNMLHFPRNGERGVDVGSNILLRANLNRRDLSNTVPFCKKRSFVSFPLLLPVRIQPEQAKCEGEKRIPSERQTERNLLACIMMIFMGLTLTSPPVRPIDACRSMPDPLNGGTSF